jgi:hypothetical protein
MRRAPRARLRRREVSIRETRRTVVIERALRREAADEGSAEREDASPRLECQENREQK